ncbi:MAG TPA: hypothetical protein PK358_16205 [Spirochaetota bacterium]|nr:hypothetical protein [Spirochaetota bacterium]
MSYRPQVCCVERPRYTFGRTGASLSSRPTLRGNASIPHAMPSTFRVIPGT